MPENEAPTPFGDPVSMVERAIDDDNFANAAKLIALLHEQQVALINSYLEWIGSWHQLLASRARGRGAVDLRTVVRRWQSVARTYTARPLLRQLKRSVLRAPASAATFSVARRGRGAAERQLQLKSGPGARREFAGYLAEVRVVHDALVDYVALLAVHVHDEAGPEVGAQEALQSLASCSYYTPAWESFLSMTTTELTTAVVEEFQGHLSGPNRKGNVTVLEDEVGFHIVLDACGSGGAMRRRRASLGLPQITVRAASPATWSLPGLVPAYCSHCAQNEITSVSRAGRLLWATEFNPDPWQPCGWVVFKDANNIPLHYYRRLGMSQPPGVKQ